jgi:diguanylate cyclase (GGDEF)-like protein
VTLGRRGKFLAIVTLTAALASAAVALALERVVADAEYDKVDTRLAAELAASVEAAESLRETARDRAGEIARDPAVQRALLAHEEGRLGRLAGPAVSFEQGGRRLAGGRVPPLRSSAAVVSRGQAVGRVVVGVPLGVVEERAALGPNGRLLWAAEHIGRTVTRDGKRYRALGSAEGGPRLTVATPLAPIEGAIAERRERVRSAVLGSFVAFILAAGLVAQLTRRPERPLRRAIDEPPGRQGRRSRAAATLVGNALAAGHDRDALLPVILDSAVAITGASGARLLADGEELARSGLVSVGRPPLVFALSAGSGQDAQLVLEPPARGEFDEESIRIAEWLAGRASIALQNAHLHVIARRLASTDELTQLANRRHFDEALRAEVLRAERFGDPVAVVVADLDNFKEVNDRYGHDVGDLVLQTFADVIRTNVRDVDLPARYGGEEFVVLLPGTGAEGGRELAERLRVSLQDLPVAARSGVNVSVTSSFGVAGFPEESSAAALLRAGDRALYRAKAAGKNAVVVAEGAKVV